MKLHRPSRVGSLIQEELGKLIQRELEFTDAVVTIVGIEVSEKLEEALVTVAVYPSAKAPDVLQLLMDHRRRLQFKLLRILNIKPMPKLVFKLGTAVGN